MATLVNRRISRLQIKRSDERTMNGTAKLAIADRLLSKFTVNLRMMFIWSRRHF